MTIGTYMGYAVKSRLCDAVPDSVCYTHALDGREKKQ